MSTLDRMDIDLTGRAVPECTCLVFTHAGPVDRIPDSYATIYGELLPVMDHRPSLPFNYEDYSAYANDPDSDETCFDIYIPISS